MAQYKLKIPVIPSSDNNNSCHNETSDQIISGRCHCCRNNNSNNSITTVTNSIDQSVSDNSDTIQSTKVHIQTVEECIGLKDLVGRLTKKIEYLTNWPIQSTKHRSSRILNQVS